MVTDDLPVEAEKAWQAYLAMITSKQAHLDFLQSLEACYPGRGKASMAEQAHLAALLEQHDRCVNEFKAAVHSLRIEQPKAYAALVIRLAQSAGTETQ